MDISFSEDSMTGRCVEDEVTSGIGEYVRACMEESENKSAGVFPSKVEQTVEKYNSWLIY